MTSEEQDLFETMAENIMRDCRHMIPLHCVTIDYDLTPAQVKEKIVGRLRRLTEWVRQGEI